MKTAIFSTLVLLIFSLIIYVFRLNQSGVDVTANSINGLVTPLISLLTAILLYKSFQAQTQFNKTQTASEEVKNDRDIIHKLITILENNIEYFSYTAQKGNVATKGMEGMKNRFKDWISDYSEQASNINYEQYNLAYSITDSKIYSIIRTSELIVDKILILQRKSMIDSEYSTLIFLFTYEMQIKPLIDELNKYGSIAKTLRVEFLDLFISKTFVEIHGIVYTYRDYFNNIPFETSIFDQQAEKIKLENLVDRILEPIYVYYQDLFKTKDRLSKKITKLYELIPSDLLNKE